MTALMLLYLVLLANTGITLLLTGILVGQIMGALILVFPMVALWATFVELRFGIAAEN